MMLATVSIAACDAPIDSSDDIRSVPIDLTMPPVSNGPPGPGKRVRMTAAEYRGTAVHHLLYLPTDWVKGSRYPVIVEYAGNGSYKNEFGDVSTGRVEGSNLGYGISGGKGFLWLCLPFISPGGTENQRRWWGDIEKTVAYCNTVVRRICATYGGDLGAVLLAGFSRGAIACNFVGLHDDEIAQLWCGFICHSHYDGVHRWSYAGSDRQSAAIRLARLGSRPQWVSHEQSVEATRRYLAQAAPDGRFRLRALPFRNHTDAWVLRGVPLRAELRNWVRATLAAR